MRNLIRRATRVTGLVDHLQPLLLLVARLYVAFIFFRSGMVKISDWGGTLALFRDEYMVPVVSPALAAYAGTFGELVLPVFLALGLAGRLSAAGLFAVNVMAVVSYPQLFSFECPAGINSHFYWGSILLGLTVFGPGRISLDALIRKRLGIVPADRQLAGVAAVNSNV